MYRQTLLKGLEHTAYNFPLFTSKLDRKGRTPSLHPQCASLAMLPTKLMCYVYQWHSPLFLCSRPRGLYVETLSSPSSGLVSLVEDHGLQLNIIKAQSIFVLPRAAITPPHDLWIRYCDRFLGSAASYKYLGVHLDCELNWHAHINHVMKKVSRKLCALSAGAKLTIQSRRRYYLSVIQPDLKYDSLSAQSKELLPYRVKLAEKDF